MRRLPNRALVAALAVEAVLVTGFAGSVWAVWPTGAETRATDEQIWYEALHDSWCRTLRID